MGDLTPNFSRAEFACPCCGNDRISPSLVAELQIIRNVAGPLTVTSGVRCAAHNEEVGGVPDSAHVPADCGDGEGVVGHAADVETAQSGKRFRVVTGAARTTITRIGVGRAFVHLDNDNRKPPHVLFHYYSAAHQA